MNDLISRQAAIDATWFEPSYTDPLNVLTEVRDRLKVLPSAQPQMEKKGEWTEDNACPFCGFQPWYERDIHTLSFCPNCGADMRGEDNG